MAPERVAPLRQMEILAHAALAALGRRAASGRAARGRFSTASSRWPAFVLRTPVFALGAARRATGITCALCAPVFALGAARRALGRARHAEQREQQRAGVAAGNERRHHPPDRHHRVAPLAAGPFHGYRKPARRSPIDVRPRPNRRRCARRTRAAGWAAGAPRVAVSRAARSASTASRWRQRRSAAGRTGSPARSRSRGCAGSRAGRRSRRPPPSPRAPCCGPC